MKHTFVGRHQERLQQDNNKNVHCKWCHRGKGVTEAFNCSGTYQFSNLVLFQTSVDQFLNFIFLASILHFSIIKSPYIFMDQQ